jgi:hypothetical protein
MKTTNLSVLALVGIISFAGQASAQSSQPEEIYVVRSVRDSRVTPTEFCGREKTGSDPVAEDQYTFRSIAVEPTGRMTNANVQTVGDFHACFGSEMPISFYAEGHLSGVSFKGLGDCQLIKENFPEQGITAFRCWLDLSDLPAQYVGGLLTSNSVYSSIKPIGTETVPEGYTQSSIATARLWEKR